MRITYGLMTENKRTPLEFKSNQVWIGKADKNQVTLKHSTISDVAAVIEGVKGRWQVRSCGPTRVEVDGEMLLRSGAIKTIAGTSRINIGPYSMVVELPQQIFSSEDLQRQEFETKLSTVIGEIHITILQRMDLMNRGPGASEREQSQEFHITLERHVEDLCKQYIFQAGAPDILIEHIAGLCVRRQIVETILIRSGEKSFWDDSKKSIKVYTLSVDREQQLDAFVRDFELREGLNAIKDVTDQIARLEKNFWPWWKEHIPDLFQELKYYLCERQIKKDIKDLTFGYGPLEDLLKIPLISEIMVVDKDRIFIEKSGVLENSGRRFISDEVTLTIIQRIVSAVGRQIDKSQPLVDARLGDGSRVNAIIPPLAVSGPCITIRKFPARKSTVAQLVKWGALSQQAAEFLQAAVLCRKNILVAGGTGTGKTTLLNCLSDFIPDKERIVTIEDTAELQLAKSHVVRLETKPPNSEGKGGYTIRDLVKNALRMRPDRIIVGECRQAEALDMLQAMNSGHDGSMTTLHANAAEEVIIRLEVLVQMAADLPISSIHRQIAAGVDMVVQLHRLRNGRRVVAQITEFVDIDPDRGGIMTRDIFLLDSEKEDAKLVPTGSLPTFMDELLIRGNLQLETFYAI
jgi:pilus assembly protein CpaF